MAKKFPSKLNLSRQRKRSAIQLYKIDHPDETSKKISQIYNVSPMTLAKWIKKDSFYDSIRKRKTKMTRKIKIFLLSNAKNKFTGINNASCRKLAMMISKTLKLKFPLSQ